MISPVPAIYTYSTLTREHHGVWNHRQFGCLFKSVYRLASKENSRARITGRGKSNTPGERNVTRKALPRHAKLFHYSDVIMGAMASQITSLTIVYSTVYSGPDQNIKAPHHWPLCGEFTGDWWISRTKGQWRGNCFYVMTSSCHFRFTDIWIGATWSLHNSYESAVDKPVLHM